MAITKILARKGPLAEGIDYILNGEKTDRLLTVHLNCDPDREVQEMLDTKQATGPNGKMDGVQYYHIVQSFKPGEVTPEQYRQFSRLAKKQKILFSAIRDKDDTGKLIDVILPVTELDRANMIFERVGYLSPEVAAPQREQKPPREERRRPRKQRDVDHPEREAPQKAPGAPVRRAEKSRQEAAAQKKILRRNSPGTRSSSSSHSRAAASTRTSDHPSVEGRLKAYRGELDRRRKSAPVRSKNKARPKSR